MYELIIKLFGILWYNIKNYYIYKTDEHNSLVYKTIYFNDDEFLKKILNFHVNINMRDNWGNTSLHIACAISKYKIAKLLLEHKANVNAINEWYGTPLHIICETGIYINYDMVKLLLEHNANVNVIDCDFQTPLHVICKLGRFEVEKLLLEYNANVNIIHRDVFCKPSKKFCYFCVNIFNIYYFQNVI